MKTYTIAVSTDFLEEIKVLLLNYRMSGQCSLDLSECVEKEDLIDEMINHAFNGTGSEGWDKKLSELKNLLEIQSRCNNWDYDAYMHGMYNGMEIAVSLFENRDPVFKDVPSGGYFNASLSAENFHNVEHMNRMLHSPKTSELPRS